MSKILDLNVFAKTTLDIMLPDDAKVYHLRKPTREMVIHVLDYQHIPADAASDIVIDRLDAMAHLILNTNDEDIAISREYVDSTLNTAQKVAVTQAYATWIMDIQSDPN